MYRDRGCEMVEGEYEPGKWWRGENEGLGRERGEGECSDRGESE